MKTKLDVYTKRFNDLRTVFDNLPEGIISILDENLVITTVNKTFAEIFHTPLDQIIGMKADKLFETKVPGLTEVLRETKKTKKGITNYTVEFGKSADDHGVFLVSTAIIDEIKNGGFGIVLILHDISEVTRLRKFILQLDRYGELIGVSDKMKKIFNFIESIKNFDTSLLISGGTGTGKELVARAVHNSSKRKNKPFIPVNCSAIPKDLIESELFGHVRGAFTGAVSNHLGRFQAADEGTLLLDEVGTLSPDTQVKLLRVIQDKIIEPLGSSKRIRVDTRIISATNRDLMELVAKGEFREDLYYRLKVLQIDLPALRDRVEDIPTLVEHFINRLNKIYKKNVIGVTPETKDILLNYQWPGNIRELENAIEHAYVSTRGILLESLHLPAEIRYAGNQSITLEPTSKDLNKEEEKIRKALLAERGNISRAARVLGIHRSTLWRKIREFRIEKDFGKRVSKR